MISGVAVSNGFAAVIDMARDGDRWPDLIDVSDHGVAQSFWCIPLAMPFVMLAQLSQRNAAANAPAPEADVNILLTLPISAYAAMCAVAAIVGWIIILGTYLFIAERIGLKGRTGPLVLGINYSTFLTYIVMGFTIGGGHMLGLAPAMEFISIALLAFALWLDWGVIRQTTGLAPWPVIGSIAFVQLCVWLTTGLVVSVFAVAFTAS